MNYLLFLQNIRESVSVFVDLFFLIMSRFSETGITYLLMAMVYWCVDKRTGRLMAIDVSISCWFSQWFRRIFKIERPWVVDYRLHPNELAVDYATGYSFPSGGTIRAIANWGILAYATKKKWVRVLCVVILVLSAFSGNYLGTHTFFDEVGAILIGLLMMQLSILVDKFLSSRDALKYNDATYYIFSILIFVLPMFIFGVLSNAGTSIGIVMGLFFERHFVDFAMPKNKKQWLCRVIPGAIIIWFLQKFLADVLIFAVPIGYATFFANFFIGFFIIGVYPFLFQKWEEKRRLEVILNCLMILLIMGIMITFYNISLYRSTKKENCLVIADGGYSSIAPKNTSAALQKAAEIGTDSIILDVQMTKDKKIVVFSDESIWKIYSKGGHIYDRTLAELKECDMSRNFVDTASSLSKSERIKNYSGLQIMTLDEALSIIDGENVDVIINIKNYEDDVDVNTVFLKKVMSCVENHLMQKRVSYASNNYSYLYHIHELDRKAKTIAPYEKMQQEIVEYDADKSHYKSAVYLKDINELDENLIEEVHENGAKCYAAGVITPGQMRRASSIGADGVITGAVGQARIAVKDDYAYIGENCLYSITVPKLYDKTTEKKYKNYVLQGMTKVRDFTVVSAYDSTKKKDSILYVINSKGRLNRVIRLGIKAHVGGIAYDEQNDLLWITASNGQVFALDWSKATASDKISVSYKFNPGLYNAKSEHVASFLTIDKGKLYVGSYCEGKSGALNVYSIQQLLEDNNTTPEKKYSIPERVQGVAFFRNEEGKRPRILFTQSAGLKNSNLLISPFVSSHSDYTVNQKKIIVPGMVEQPVFSGNELYLLFESSARKYRVSYRIPSDQIWVTNYTY